MFITRYFIFSLPLFSLLLVWGISSSPLYQRLALWIDDQQQALFAEEHYFDDVLVLDIDDESLSALKTEFGVWPYDRNFYALVLDYLRQKGGGTVVFDILFAEPREGDKAFAESLKRYQKAILATAFPTVEGETTIQPKYNASLFGPLTWSVSKQMPLEQMYSFLPPAKQILDDAGAVLRVGGVNVFADSDGTVRRIPAFYQVDDLVLPSLPLVAQNPRAEKQAAYDKESGTVVFEQKQWPVDEQGRMQLNFPKNANTILSLSFYKVVQAAQGKISPPEASHLFKGKTIFIGSTAFKSDRVNTPRGMMSGTYLLAIAYQNMKQAQLLKQMQSGLNLLWIALALLPALSMVRYHQYRPSLCASYSLLAGSIIVLGNGLIQQAWQQPSILLFPILLVVSSYLFYILFFSLFINRHNRQLQDQQQLLQQENVALESAANLDGLTQIYNRRAYLKLFAREQARLQQEGSYFSVVIMDLDHFKNVNDQYGHKVGDEVLKMFATLLKNTIRKNDIVARWGGEEFVAIFPGTGGKEAAQVLDKVRRMLNEQVVETELGLLQVSVSIGVDEYTDSGLSAEDAIARADKALYEAKATGRNRICMYKR